MKVTALAGGVGGAKLAHGLSNALPVESLSVIVNTGDDFTHMGLQISPDVDTVVYTLAGLANLEYGWGRAGETWQALNVLRELGESTWFQLGDFDLGLHLYRSEHLRSGETLSSITGSICKSWDVAAAVLPMSDDPVRTMVETADGELPFQEYFVAMRCEPRVRGFRFDGLETARPAPGVLAAIEEADLIVLCPSNPWVSIDPILALTGVRSRIAEKPVVGVSPIIAGRTLKGPAAAMYSDMGIKPSAFAVANHYRDLLDGFVIDQLDEKLIPSIQTLGMRVLAADTIMRTGVDRTRLAREVLAFAGTEVGA